MRKPVLIALLMIVVTIAFVSCDKEKIVESTEIREVTTTIIDTVFVRDTVNTQLTDTVTITVSDTVIQYISQPADTVIQYITVTDTVVVGSNGPVPDVSAAFTAMQAYTDVVVIEAINAELGYTDGWIFYLSAYMSYIAHPSENVWDFSGYIDYWAPDWSDFYAFEYGWRLTYVSGDPEDPNNWSVSEIPAGAPNGASGLKVVDKSVREALK